MNLDTITFEEIIALNEKHLRLQVILPLLRELGAENIMDLHGVNELGIDIYCEWRDVFNVKRGFAIQIKAGDVTCKGRPDKSPDVIEICRQIEMTKAKEIILTDRVSKVTVDGYYVFISGKINDTARDYILSQKAIYSYLAFLDGDFLFRTIKNRSVLKARAFGMVPPQVI